MMIEGTILQGDEFEPIEGRVVIEDGEISAIEEADSSDSNLICPAFINAHTHIGDSIAKEAGAGLSLEELVAPPDGLKHRLLRQADRTTHLRAIRHSIRFMEASGTAAFLDFREGGVEGVELLQEAATDLDPRPIILARETEAAMKLGDGFGASSARDGEYSQERAATRSAGKLFGIHAGERDSEDIDGGFALDPDFIVHMVHPEPEHLDRLAASDTPVVVCPRSNHVTNAGMPPIEALLDRTTVALGTDNVMLNSPSMFREMEWVAKLTDLPATRVLRMATRSGAEIAGLDFGLIEPGRPAKLIVIDSETDNLTGSIDPVRAIVRRATVSDVSKVVL